MAAKKPLSAKQIESLENTSAIGLLLVGSQVAGSVIGMDETAGGCCTGECVDTHSLPPFGWCNGSQPFDCCVDTNI